MKKLLLLLLLLPVPVSAQNKTEIREFTGRILAIEPAFRVAYERIRMDVAGEEAQFLFWPNYGKYILDHLKVGDQTTLRAEVNLIWERRRKEFQSDPKMKKILSVWGGDRITEILIDGKWVPLPYSTVNRINERPVGVFLEKTILQVYPNDQDRKVFIFQDGLAANFSFMAGNPDFRPAKRGDVVSFFGYAEVPQFSETAVFPVSGIKKVYSYSPLIRNSGQLKSLLYKQNSVCIGMVMKTNDEEIQVSFPSDLAREVRDFVKDGRQVNFYYIGFKVEHQPNPFELHALVAGSDTLRIERGLFYGGEDVAHDHKPVEVTGKITRVDRSPRQKIMSIMVGKDAYVDIDAATAQQLDKLFRKGAGISVQGDERIRKNGEIYRETYRIITPRKLVIEGKEFLIK
ncbi:MAG: hypothetical protein U0289_13370 [Cyclobacteriaceae bacterium]|jgi:hypothetical protein|nr:hypothetical protein [Cytophagales bacterium]HNP76548.1 hypothetical protein [Cyclobacteriaceae bacterium]